MRKPRGMSSVRWFLLSILVMSLPSLAGPPGVVDPLELRQAEDASWLEGRDLVFYAEDLQSGERYAFNGTAIDQRHTPWSSFKIPNLLIALETGAAADLEHPIVYDASRRPAESYWPADWRSDQTLRTAFQRSAAWYFQDLALKIGSDSYKGYLGHFGYGNARVPAGNDSFWLDGTLQVSPGEQVSFLRRLLIGQLEVSPRNLRLLSEVSVLERAGDSVLHGKTGSGPRRPKDYDGPFEGWLVGWVQRPDDKPVVFATWAAAPTYGRLSLFRQEASERLLARLGAWPAPASFNSSP